MDDSPVKWCLKENFAREMVSNCNVGATTYMVCWVEQFRFLKFSLQVLQALPDIQKEFSKFSLEVNCWEVHSNSQISIEQFRFSKFSLQVLQPLPLPDIQKGIFEIQLAGYLLRGPFPDLHRAISIFKIQFAGAVMRDPFPDLHTAISIFKI